MKFSIITPTHRRAEELARAVRSVQAQTYPEWEMIIVNDSPTDKTYLGFISSINDPRIRYVENDRNMGVNFSRNHALNAISAASNWIIFLDDDDYFAPDALKTFHDLILAHPRQEWFMTNRAYTDGTPITYAPESDKTYSYAREYLIMRKIKGDATHIMKTDLINKIRFLNNVKQAEEWFFFYQVGLHTKLFYHDHNSTISDGYNKEHGLNFRKRSKEEQLKTLLIILYEAVPLKLLYHPSFIAYIAMRLLRILY